MHVEQVYLITKSNSSLQAAINRQGNDFNVLLRDLKRAKTPTPRIITADTLLPSTQGPSKLTFGVLDDLNSVTSTDNADAFRKALATLMRDASAVVKGADATLSAVSILDSLSFREMPMRHLEISDTYARTYTWVFDERSSPLVTWLQWYDGVCWVSRKTGSGKSTLMKFIADHSETKRILKSQSPSTRLCVLSFYFWNAGYPMPRSQQRLLQSLLFQVLKANPHIIENACPGRWNAEDRSRPAPWSRSEVVQSLESSLALLASNTRFCLFIEGQDELAGDHFELVTFLDRLAQYAHVKVCASSRPWIVFRKAYTTDQTRMIRLEDLTQRDMQIYVNGWLESDPRFRQLASVNMRAGSLVQEIYSMADGVFLWVFLVVRSLLRGLSDDDDIPTLQRRLRALPKDSRSWFRDMLANIDEIYQQNTACALLLACSSEGPLPILAISHIAAENDNQRFAIDASLGPMPTETYEAMLYNVRSIVNKWCRDLLEVRETRAIKVTQIIDKHKVDYFH